MRDGLFAQIQGSPALSAGIFGVTYFLGAELGHVLSVESAQQGFATFWPPAGLLLGVLALSRPWSWLAYLLAAFVANLVSDVGLHDQSLPVSLGFCLANSGGACLGAYLIRRWVGVPITLARMNEVLGLAFIATLSSALAATLGAGVIALHFGHSFWSAWQMWWVANAAGVFVLAPVVFTWPSEGVPTLKNLPWQRVGEGVVLVVGLTFAMVGVYGEWLPQALMIPVLILPFLLWAGLRFGPPGAAVTMMIVALVGSWNIAHGRGPYAAMSDDPREQVARAQVTLCVISVALLALSAVVAERKHAEQQRVILISQLELALSEIKTLRGLIPLCAWCKKIRNDQGFWQNLEDYLLAHTEAKLSHGICPDCLKEQVASIPESLPSGTPR